jgi:lysyl-tRNA synthetase class 2
MQLSEQELRRREEKSELEKLGIDPYPPELFEVNVSTRDIRKNYEKQKTDYKNISIAGRIMSRRIMGSASFAELQDEYGKIQIYLRRDDICPGEDKTLYNVVFKRLLDIGDIIGIKGYLFTTQTGELSIYVNELKVLTKSLRPLPIVKETTDQEGKVVSHDAFKDAEQRYRQRYVDLIVNSGVKETFKKRTQLVNSIRDYLNGRGYLEVETPILQPLYGGAAAKPFKPITIPWT